MPETSQEAAVAAVMAAEAAGNVAAATIVFDALDQNAAELSQFDRYDFALSTWNRLVDIDSPITDDDIVALIIRAAEHLPEHTVVDLIDGHYGEREITHRLDDGRQLAWLPGDHVAILTAPVAQGFVDVVLGRRAAQARA